MAIKTSNELGSIAIADTVLATIAGLAAMQCAGIVGMASQGAAEGIAELLKIESLTKGVKVISDGTVKYSIESMTGLIVDGVNVYIKGVRV